ncbi:ATP-binding protein [Actinocrispum sp. NPDC049592]|uniref:sensor histidine kinase n=1 Tax=Actinocrispum sp. NPDC049592 TaxID=3154835 RepID=UPI0034286FA9
MRALAEAAPRYALWLRAAIVVLSGVFSLGSDARLWWLVAIASLWCAVRIAWKRQPVWVLGGDGLLVVVVGLSQLAYGSQSVSSWVFAVASISSVTCHYEWGARGWIVAGLSIGAYTAGNVIAGPDPGLAGLTGRLIVQSILCYLSLRFLRRAAKAADATAAKAAARRRAAAVATARRNAEREYLATLHDTASTTLLMVSLGTSSDWLPERARRDLEALSVHDIPEGDVDLAAILKPLADEPDITVTLHLDDDLTMPAAPAVAIFLGLQEALTNVRRHAGVDAVTLHAQRDNDRISVELKDNGRGFDGITPQKRGIQHSIKGRMDTVNGDAEVTSAPGQGTTVRWRWPGE